MDEIKKLLENDMINCLFIENTLAGFLISHKLGKNLIEINGLYVKPQFRKNNLCSLLIEHATKNTDYSYFGATFLENIKTLLELHGFEETSLNYLNYREKFNFLKQRFKFHRIKEVFRHKKNSKLILLKKECRK
jgi:ribosomal protein S18 acetylase RimI-like enzyme